MRNTREGEVNLRLGSSQGSTTLRRGTLDCAGTASAGARRRRERACGVRAEYRLRPGRVSYQRDEPVRRAARAYSRCVPGGVKIASQNRNLGAGCVCPSATHIDVHEVVTDGHGKPSASRAEVANSTTVVTMAPLDVSHLSVRVESLLEPPREIR